MILLVEFNKHVFCINPFSSFSDFTFKHYFKVPQSAFLSIRSNSSNPTFVFKI